MTRKCGNDLHACPVMLQMFSQCGFLKGLNSIPYFPNPVFNVKENFLMINLTVNVIPVFVNCVFRAAHQSLSDVDFYDLLLHCSEETPQVENHVLLIKNFKKCLFFFFFFFTESDI